MRPKNPESPTPTDRSEDMHPRTRPLCFVCLDICRDLASIVMLDDRRKEEAEEKKKRSIEAHARDKGQGGQHEQETSEESRKEGHAGAQEGAKGSGDIAGPTQIQSEKVRALAQKRRRLRSHCPAVQMPGLPHPPGAAAARRHHHTRFRAQPPLAGRNRHRH